MGNRGHPARQPCPKRLLELQLGTSQCPTEPGEHQVAGAGRMSLCVLRHWPHVEESSVSHFSGRRNKSS